MSKVRSRSPGDASTHAAAPRLVPLWVCAILLASYAFFWQARDWNSASRLMLTYALVDRLTISLDGLEEQTRDIASFRGKYYTDKLPGFSLLAVVPYALAKTVFWFPDHPLHQPGFPYWPADYWVTLGTSGLATALTGALLVVVSGQLGCGLKRSALVGLAYGLATPAYAYATMSYGHPISAFALLASFALLWDDAHPRARLRAGAAGVLAALAAVVELQVGPVSALLGLYLLAQVLSRRRRLSGLAAFAVGAAVPTLILLGYNLRAFGSPWDMGYFHHANPRFHVVHSARNPLGLLRPDWSLAFPLLWGGYRGLLFYAPILLLAVPGWIVLCARRLWGVALLSLTACVAIFLVNLSYPEWTGGWSTGPRLLVPLLPFALLPVAGLLAVVGRRTALLATALALAGAGLLLLFLGVGARIPETVADPLGQLVWPLWRGDPVPEGWPGGRRFARNLVFLLCPKTIASLPPTWQWVQFLPLIALEGLAIAGLVRSIGQNPRTADLAGRRPIGPG